MPNWISNPSVVVPAGTAMMPALFMRMSRREEEERNVAAAAWTEERDERSRERKVMLALGTVALISVIAASALDCVRAAR